MRNFILKRLGISVIILLFVMFIIFVLMRCLPASYVETMAQQLSQAPGSKPYEEWVEQLNAQYGLNTDIVTGHFIQLKNMVTLNFGDSWKWTVPVLQKFNDVIWLSFTMGAISLVLELRSGPVYLQTQAFFSIQVRVVSLIEVDTALGAALLTVSISSMVTVRRLISGRWESTQS